MNAINEIIERISQRFVGPRTVNHFTHPNNLWLLNSKLLQDWNLDFLYYIWCKFNGLIFSDYRKEYKGGKINK